MDTDLYPTPESLCTSVDISTVVPVPVESSSTLLMARYRSAERCPRIRLHAHAAHYVGRTPAPVENGGGTRFVFNAVQVRSSRPRRPMT